MQVNSKTLEQSTISPPVATVAAKKAVACRAPAFPGAEGFGAWTRGGRGGRVIAVTNLNSDGPGSLREALTASGPRIVVFHVGGTIELEERIKITEPYITIAGQTAPGGGISIRSKGNTTDLITVATHDVIVRYLRLRPGPGGDSRAITASLGDTHDVIIDHVSASWGVDENITTWYDVHDITIQWSLIGEGLHNSTHSEGAHSKGMLLGSEGSYNISVHHNLYVHNDERNPRIKTDGLVDFTNNVIYNYGDSAGWITNDFGALIVNFVGNYYKPGPNSVPDLYELDIDRLSDGKLAVFVEGNLGPNRTQDDQPQDAIVKADDHEFLTAKRHKAPTITTTSAQTAYEQVLAGAGATLPERDEVDRRLVADVVNGTGAIIDHPDQVGGWPIIANGVTPTDEDGDGMPNIWEENHQLNPRLETDGSADADHDGYTNVEEYLNNTNPHDDSDNAWDECTFFPAVQS